MRKFSIPNGVRVVLDQTGEPTAAIAVMINSGSRNDPPGLPGLHHAFEHLITRATEDFSSWEALCGYTDEFASAYNAWTDKSTILVYVKMESGRIRSGLRLIDQVFNYPELITNPEAVEHLIAERGRLTNERMQANDLTDERVDDQLDRIMLTGGLAHTIDGPVKVIKRYTGARLRELYQRLVIGKRLTVVVSGGFNEAIVEASIRRIFGKLRPGRVVRTARAHARRTQPRFWLKNDDTREQVHFSLGFSTFGVDDPDRYALLVLRNYLSHRSSSRIRVALDSLGYGYSSNDYMMFYPELGQYGVRVWIEPGKYVNALKKIAEELSRICSQLITDEELRRSKRHIRLDTFDEFSDPLYRARFMASQIAILGRYVPVREYLSEINKVTKQRVRRVARQIFAQRRMVLVATGPMAGISKKQVREALRFRKRKPKSTKPQS